MIPGFAQREVTTIYIHLPRYVSWDLLVVDCHWIYWWFISRDLLGFHEIYWKLLG